MGHHPVAFAAFDDYLRQAIDHGLSGSNLRAFDRDEDLGPLRGDAQFEALAAEAKKRLQE